MATKLGDRVRTDETTNETTILHPLAIVSMSSLFTRVTEDAAVDKKVAPDSLIGCLIGTIQERRTDIHDVYEFPYKLTQSEAGVVQLDVDYADDEETKHFDKCKELALEVHNTGSQKWDVVGWFRYSRAAPKSTAEREQKLKMDYQVNKILKARLDADRLLFLSLTADCQVGSEELPIQVYGEEAGGFRLTQFKVQADNAEGVAMGHIEKMKAEDNGDPPLASRLRGVQAALRKLQDRIQVLKQFLVAMKATHSSGAPMDRELLRQVAHVMNQLPALDASKFAGEFVEEYNNSQLVTYLAVATKMATTMETVLEKSAVVSGGARLNTSGRGGGGGGSSFADFDSMDMRDEMED